MKTHVITPATSTGGAHDIIGIPCWIHHVIEPTTPTTFRQCGECFHVYETEADLARIAWLEWGPDPDLFEVDSLRGSCPLCATG